MRAFFQFIGAKCLVLSAQCSVLRLRGSELSPQHWALSTFLLIATTLPSLSHAQFTADWEPAAETVVLYNPKFPGSEALAKHYAAKRLIPADRVIGLDCPVTDSMSRTEFNQQLREPLRKIFAAKKWWTLDKDSVAHAGVRVLVVMRGVPFQVRRDRDAPQPQKEDEASVDSELTLLAMNAPPTEGALKNPYYGADVRLPRFTKAPGLLLVGRLDGPSDDIVRRMIDDALFAEENGLQGRAVIDLALKSGGFKEGEDWLLASAATFQRHGIPLYIDRDELVMRDHWPLPDTILYYGWYTMDAAGAVASPEFQFRRGAVACHIHSFSASVMRDPKQHWTGPLLVKGAAATFGNVFEPYLSLTVHFDLLNKRLLEGFTLAEAAWSATPALSWMSVVVGDPLYRPFAKTGGALLGSDEMRDYLLYQGAARRSPLALEATIKTTITALAERRKSSRMLEFTGLLSALQGKHAEAVDLFDHAEALTASPADRVRLRLYRAEMLRRDSKPQTAADLLRDLLSDDSVKAEPARPAAGSMLLDVGG